MGRHQPAMMRHDEALYQQNQLANLQNAYGARQQMAGLDYLRGQSNYQQPKTIKQEVQEAEEYFLAYLKAPD